jgi:Cdc6-like AAA superfamily ATPase
MFLQGPAGTGKTFTVKALINTLESCFKKCLICGTTGIAAVQYPGGTTLHSLFHLGIDEELRGSF